MKSQNWCRGLIGVGVLVAFSIIASLNPAHGEEPSSAATGSSGSQALWVADSSAFAEYVGKHLVLAFNNPGFTPYSMTFDSSGNFWGTFCTNIDGNPKLGLIFELTKSEILDIENGLLVTPKVEFQNPKLPLNFDCPAAIQFDQSGNLWVANKGADTKKPSIMKYTMSQLVSGGKVAPTFFTSRAIETIWDMKFDESGNLWLAADGVPQNKNGGIFEIKSDQLSAVGSEFTVTFDLEVTSDALNLPTTLTFDNGGNLWTVGNGNTVLLFHAGDLGGSGTVSATPTVTLSSSIRKNRNYSFFKPGGLTVDASGDLWVSSEKNGGGPKKQLGAVCEFSPDGIATSGSPQCNLYAVGKPMEDHPAELTTGPQL